MFLISKDPSGNNTGQIMYLNDYFKVTLPSITCSITASDVASVDSRFTITMSPSSITGSASAYEVWTSNINPLNRNNNEVNLNPNGYRKALDNNYTVNPKLETSFVKLGNFDVNGLFQSNSYVRLIRIQNSAGLHPNIEAYIFTEKQVPAIS